MTKQKWETNNEKIMQGITKERIRDKVLRR